MCTSVARCPPRDIPRKPKLLTVTYSFFFSCSPAVGGEERDTGNRSRRSGHEPGMREPQALASQRQGEGAGWVVVTEVGRMVQSADNASQLNTVGLDI